VSQSDIRAAMAAAPLDTQRANDDGKIKRQRSVIPYLRDVMSSFAASRKTNQMFTEGCVGETKKKEIKRWRRPSAYRREHNNSGHSNTRSHRHTHTHRVSRMF